MGSTDVDNLKKFLTSIGFTVAANFADQFKDKTTGSLTLAGLTGSASKLTDLNTDLSELKDLKNLEELTINNISSLKGADMLSSNKDLPSSLKTLDLKQNGLCVGQEIKNLSQLSVIKSDDGLLGLSPDTTILDAQDDANCKCGNFTDLNVPYGITIPSGLCTDHGKTCTGTNKDKCTSPSPGPSPGGCKIKGNLTILAGANGGKLQIPTSGCSPDSVKSEDPAPAPNPEPEPTPPPNPTPTPEPVSEIESDYYSNDGSCPNCNKNLLRNDIDDKNDNEISYDNKDSNNEICEHCLVTIGDEKHCNKFLDKEDCDYLGDSYSWKGN